MTLGICDVPVDYQSQSQIPPLLVMHGHRLYSFYMLLLRQPCTCKGEYRAFGKLDSYKSVIVN